MSDASEVKAAAERLRPLLGTQVDAWNAPALRDMWTVVEAYLRLTDETPIDEAWVDSLGWQSKGQEYFPRWLSPKSLRGGPTVGVVWEPMLGCDAWSLDGELIPPLSTRGELRMLCAAIGIELKEGSK